MFERTHSNLIIRNDLKPTLIGGVSRKDGIAALTFTTRSLSE
jgi:hypothetical protein